MEARETRTGRVFSPYEIATDVDTERLVEAAWADGQQGLDSWELDPLTPLSSPELSAQADGPALPDGTISWVLPTPAPLDPSAEHGSERVGSGARTCDGRFGPAASVPRVSSTSASATAPRPSSVAAPVASTPPAALSARSPQYVALPSPRASPAASPAPRLLPALTLAPPPSLFANAVLPDSPPTAATSQPPPAVAFSALAPAQARLQHAVPHAPAVASSRASTRPRSGKKAHASAGKYARRQRQRSAAKEGGLGKKARSSYTKRASQTAIFKGETEVHRLPIARGAHVGKVLAKSMAACRTLEELKADGYQYFEWDGRTPYRLLDREGRVIGLLAGRPGDPLWDQVAAQAYSAMQEAGKGCSFQQRDVDHRRGKFGTHAIGVLFGGGRKTPGNVHNSVRNQKILTRLCAVPAIKRLAGFGSAMAAAHAPQIFENMRHKLEALRERHPSLQFNFKESVYPATSFNFGPATVCIDHTDAANDPCNWCHIVALGRFNCDKGGQIVFPGLKLAIRFPQGSSILIPSAILRHANTPIGPHEERMSMTQYCAGALLQWVECGFRTVGDFEEQDPVAYGRYLAGLEGRVHRACALFERVELKN